MMAMYFITVLCFFIIIQFRNLECQHRCTRFGKPACCPDSRYNKHSNKCEDCPIGYHYWNCSRKCEHPFYGKDCQKDCNCGKDECHYSKGCPSTKFSTHVTTNADSENMLYTTTRIRTDIITQLPYKRTTAAKQPNDFLSHKTNFILIIGSVGLGLFLLLFGMLVGVYIYKSLQRNVGRMSVNEVVSKEEHNYTTILRQSESQQRVLQAGNVSENSGYLSPVSEAVCQYEEVVMYDLPDESGNLEECQDEQCYNDTILNVTDTYLTPQSVPQHVYVEVI